MRFWPMRARFLLRRVCDDDGAQAVSAAETRARGTSWWMVLWVLVSVVVVVAAFLVGRLVRSPWDEAAANAATRPVATAEVAEQEFPAESASASGTLRVGDSIEVLAAGGEGPAVITAERTSEGKKVASGSVVADVSGRPIIALRLPFPLFRDLGPGDSGEDVTAVQEALADLGLYRGRVDGRYGQGTVAAVRALYTRAGVVPPGPAAGTAEALRSAEAELAAVSADSTPAERAPLVAARDAARAAAATPLPAAEIVAISHESYTVSRVAPRGTVLASDAPVVAVLVGGTPTATARVAIDDEDAFAKGDPVSVTLVGSTTAAVEGTIASIGEFAADGAQAAGFDVTVSLSGLPEGAREGAAVMVEPEQAGAAVTALAVPLVSVREDSAGAYVLVVVGDDDTAPGRVGVELGAQHDGWVQVLSGEVVAGDLVVVAGA